MPIVAMEMETLGIFSHAFKFLNGAVPILQHNYLGLFSRDCP